jgi:hypothetical protein
MDQVIALLQEIAQQDLEQCEAAIKTDDKTKAVAAIEVAFAKLDTAIDMLRNQGHTRG